MSAHSTSIILLAAGASRRMQRAKQLLPLGDQTLLERAIDQALKSELGPVTVVYGAHAKLVLPLIQQWSVDAIYNPDWEEGLGASLRTGVTALLDKTTPDQILVTLGDQPLVDAPLLKSLVHNHQAANYPVTAAQYGETFGVPAVFSAEIYPFLQDLAGDQGAKGLLKKFKANHQLNLFPAPQAATDLDTPDDWVRFLE